MWHANRCTVYTNPIVVYSLFPLTFFCLKTRQYLPSLPFFSSHPDIFPPHDNSSWRSGVLTATFILAAISLLVIYVQIRHHRIFSAIMQRKLAQPDMRNIVQYYADGGVVLVLPVDRELKGVIAVEETRRSENQAKARKWVIHHLVLNLPERTRRQAATALCTLALERMFSPSGTTSGSGKSSSSNPRQPMNTDRVLVLTEPLALEGEKFYHELGFTRTGDAPLEEVEIGEDLTTVPVTGASSTVGSTTVGGDMAFKGKRAWLEMSREEWARRYATNTKR